jgi:NAD(P)-dependent dehydrogenase (short-subunit alcohol dehydrogenase family)
VWKGGPASLDGRDRTGRLGRSDALTGSDSVTREMEAGGTLTLVTGANRGLGLEVCRQLSAAGWEVILTARDADKAQAAAEGLARDGLTVLPRQLDVADEASVWRLARELADQIERIDVLINNAGILYDTWQSAADADLEVVREAFETNTLGAWRTCQALLPMMRRSPHPRIVNVSSGAGAMAEMAGGHPAYRTSKTALNALTRMLAAELRGDGFLVNSVCPGWVATDMGGPGGRPLAEGAASIVWAATLPADGPTGGFFRNGRPIDW